MHIARISRLTRAQWLLLRQQVIFGRLGYQYFYLCTTHKAAGADGTSLVLQIFGHKSKAVEELHVLPERWWFSIEKDHQFVELILSQ